MKATRKLVALEEVTVEGKVEGRPHEGQVLAAIQAHADDIPLFCGGTVAKLIDDGYTGYLIQTTNDEKCGPTSSIGETVLSNEKEVEELAGVLGLRQVFNLGYRNHRLDEASPVELRARLIFLIRYLKVDTVLTFNPWGINESNPDHHITARAVEAACWMAGMAKDYPEQVAAGIGPHGVKDKYYWACRTDQPYNRVVDIAAYMDAKIASMAVNKSQGPAGSNGRWLKARLAAQGRSLPELEGDDETADREYIRLFGLGEYRAIGAAHGLEYGEAFYHVDQRNSGFLGSVDGDEVERYVSERAVPIDEL